MPAFRGLEFGAKMPVVVSVDDWELEYHPEILKLKKSNLPLERKIDMAKDIAYEIALNKFYDISNYCEKEGVIINFIPMDLIFERIDWSRYLEERE